MRERIIEIATAMFIERGFTGVAMREISEACGITKAALYYHFTNKAEILHAIVYEYLDSIATIVESAVAAGGSSTDQVRHLVRGLSHQPAEARAILRVAMHDLSNLGPEGRAAFRKDYSARFLGPVQQIFLEGEAAGEFRTVDPTFIGWVILGMVYPFFGPPGGPVPETTDETIESILDVLLNGVAERS